MRWTVKQANYPSELTTKDEDDFYHSLLDDGFEPFAVTREEQYCSKYQEDLWYSVVWLRRIK